MTRTASTAVRALPSEPVGYSIASLKCTGATVRRLARRITSFYEVHMLSTGLKLSQYSLLAHLSPEPQSLLTLSRRLEMDRTTLTRNLKPLIAARWVSEVAGNDARQRLFVRTASGERLYREARQAWKAAQAELQGHLGDEFVAHLHAQLDEALVKLKAVLPQEN